MKEYKVDKIKNLSELDLKRLVKQSKEEGFRFIERLVNDYENGDNTFKGTGEALLAVFNKENEIIAIGGLNIDPFSKDQNVGRLRRFYVSKECRRSGIGTVLLKAIINEAKKNFNVLVLHTDTKEADNFYIFQGFTREERYPKSTHYMKLR